MADKINPYFLKKPDKYLLSSPTPLATKPTLRDTVKKIATTPTPPYLLDSPDKADSRKRSVMRDELNTRAASDIANSNNPVSALLAPNGWSDAKDTFNDSIDRQGGWGLSEDTRKFLGADDTQRDNSSPGNYLLNVKRPVQNLVANAGDLAFRAYQAAMAGTETAALGLDKGVDNAGLGNSTDKIAGFNHSFQPGHGALALMEAFPDGGLHTGIPAVNPREIAGYYAARRGDLSMTPVVDSVSGSVIDHVPSDTVPPKAGGGRQPYVVKPEVVEVPQTAPESVPAPAAAEVPSVPEPSPAPPQTATELTPQSYADTAAEKGLGFINSPEAVDYYTKNAPAIAEELDRRVNNPNEPYTGVDRRIPADDTARGSDEEFTNPVNGDVNEATFRSTEGLKKLMEERGVTPETLVNPDVPKKEWETPTVKTDSVTDATRSDTPAEHPDASEPSGEGPDTSDVEGRLTEALNSARRLLPSQRTKYREARSEKFAKLKEVSNYTSGREGFYAEKAQLKGELPKEHFEAVEDQFTPEEINTLFEKIKNHPDLGGYEPVNARDGLNKLLTGELPTRSEVALLTKVFSKDFLKAALSNRSRMAKFGDAYAQVAGLSRSLTSSYDISAPFRQGLFMMNRGEFWKNLPTLVKSFASKTSHENTLRNLRTRPNYGLYDEGGLYLANRDRGLAGREEAFPSALAEEIPVIGRGVKMSGRSYDDYLDNLRADVFDTLVDQYHKLGVDVSEHPEILKGMASYINNGTGRGSLGPLEPAAHLLNTPFFSPRLFASRLQTLNPYWYYKLPPLVRKEAIKSLLALGSVAGIVTGLLKAGGAKIETDPRSSNFNKIPWGNTKYDTLGGYGQLITLGARLASNQTKTGSGEVQTLGTKFGQPTRLGVLERFGESKLSPNAGFIADYLRGKDYNGEPFDLRDEGVKMFTPMFLHDLYDAINDSGPIGAVKAAPGVVGFGANTYSPIGPAPASLKVDGVDVPLNREARTQYKKMVQSYLDVNLDTLKKSGDWDKYTLDEQSALTAQIVKDGRKQAKTDLFETGTDKSEDIPGATAQPVVKPGEALFDGFPGLPQSVGRTAKGNEKVGGVPNSDHLRGDAVDFTPPPGMSMSQLEAAARRYFSGMYILNEGNHVHVRIPGLHGPLYGKNGTVK